MISRDHFPFRPRHDEVGIQSQIRSYPLLMLLKLLISGSRLAGLAGLAGVSPRDCKSSVGVTPPCYSCYCCYTQAHV